MQPGHIYADAYTNAHQHSLAHRDGDRHADLAPFCHPFADIAGHANG